MDAFDADALIYAADPAHPRAAALRALLERADAVGSVLLLPEVLSKPLRQGHEPELRDLLVLLSRLRLVALDESVARLATALGAQHGLRAADAVHLATAVHAGAERFITNNRRDFPMSITEVEVVYPDDLPETLSEGE